MRVVVLIDLPEFLKNMFDIRLSKIPLSLTLSTNCVGIRVPSPLHCQLL